MRFKTLSECRQYILNRCVEAKMTPEDFTLEAMSYDSQQVLSGGSSVGVTSHDGKNTKSRLQIILERFNCGTYEVVCYVA